MCSPHASAKKAFSSVNPICNVMPSESESNVEVIRRFYDTIRTAAEPPVAYREIILTARIMDEIFAQIYPERLETKAIANQTTAAALAAARVTAKV